jgi:Fur family transcriptional regulator, ferric uptake regulator
VDTSLRHTLHERGLRMTPQRQLVLDAVRALDHATPEQICAEVQRSAPAVNLTTIYRTLDLLDRIGLVRHTHLGHGAPTYSAQEHEHVHLVCHSCGAVTELPTELMDGLAADLAGRSGFALDVSHLALSGLCTNCQEATHEAP